MLRHAMACLLVLGCCAATVRAQDDEGGASAASDIARVQRDQSRIGVRIASLREKMERLAQRYDDEGRTRNATLLREALKEFDGKQVQDTARELERNLSQSNLSSVEQQDALVTSLEQVYAVLRDRRDADELQRQTDLARKAVEELSTLAKNERRLLSRTRAATDKPGSLVQQALQLAQQLQQALASASDATKSAESATGALGDSALADALAREQRALAEDPAATAEMQALLEQGLELLRKQLEKPVAGEAGAPSPAVGDELLSAAEAARADARQAAADAAEAMAAARERLKAESAGGAGKPAAPGEKSPGGKPSDSKPSSGEPAGGKPAAGDKAAAAAAGDKAAGADGSGEKSADGQPGGEKSDGAKASGAKSDGAKADGAQADGAKSDGAKSDGAKADGEKSGGASADGAQPAGEKAAGSEASGGDAGGKSKPGGQQAGAQKPGGAQAAGAQGGEKPPGENGKPEAQSTPAQQSMEEAAAALEDTRDALERSERSLGAARNRARALALAASQEAAQKADSMEDLAQRLDAVAPEVAPELLERTRQLLEDLKKASAAVDEGDNAAAGAAQATARATIDDLIKQLQARAGENPDSAPRAPDAEELKSLAQEQQELKRQVAELMKRLEELPEKGFQSAAEQAQKAMGQAESALNESRTDEAAVREEEAAEQLEQAKDKLAGESDQYEQLRQEEVLFRVGEELKTLLEKHDAATAETLELDTGRGDADRLGRSQRRAATRLSGTEKELSVQAEALRAALEKDGSVAFTFALEHCRDDLKSAADLLADEQTGFLVQSVQGDVHQRLVDLLAVLDAEQERRRNAKTEPPQPGNQGQQKTPLVPTVAELLLIQRMEQAALARLQNFQRNNPGLADPDGIDPVERELLGRWALEHTAVTELFRKMIPSAPVEVGTDAPGAAPPEGGHPEGGVAPPQPPKPEPVAPEPHGTGGDPK